jgi:alpha-galactosidase
MEFSFTPETGTMQFAQKNSRQFSLENAIFALDLHIGNRRIKESSADVCFQREIQETMTDNVFGKSLHELYWADSGKSQARYQVEFLIPDDEDVVLWRLRITNKEQVPYCIHQFNMLEVNAKQASLLQYQGAMEDLRFFSQGWQSWSHTASYGVHDRMITSNLSIAQEPLCYDHGTPRYHQKGKFSSDFFTILSDSASHDAVLMGFLSQQEQFGAVSLDLNQLNSLKLWAKGDDTVLPAGQTMQTDWAIVQFIKPCNDPLERYCDWVRLYHEIAETPAVYTGWCSWYYYYQNISEGSIRENLKKIVNLQGEIPLHLVQIDDGYEQQVGDWLKFQPGFPQGVAGLADSIKENGLIPGLWIAPFIVHPKSDLMKEHPDWILRNHHGRAVNAGFIWNVFTTSLDLTNPQAMAYAIEALKTAAEQWHFPYLKLDFLYAAALPGKHYNPTLTRAQVLRKAYEKLREAVGSDVYLLGCGAPIGTSIGIFDAMRIGADVSGSWTPKYLGLEGLFRGEPNMPSARNAIQNVLTRQYMHNKWWINDPDCLLVRPDSELTLDEVKTLTSVIGLSGGAFLVSDDMTTLPPDRIQLIQKVMPVHSFPVDVLDLFQNTVPETVMVNCLSPQENWKVIARYNWKDQADQVTINLQEFNFPAGEYWVRSFWDNQVQSIKSNTPLVFNISAHGCVVLAIRPFDANIPAYLGGYVHILQGLELTTLKRNRNGMTLIVDLAQQMEGWVDVYYPDAVKSVSINEKAANWQHLKAGVYRIFIQGKGKQCIEIVE